MVFLFRIVLDVLFATLWQGAIIACCCTVVLKFAGNRFSAATRHIVLLGALAAIALVPCATTIPSVLSQTEGLIIRWGPTVERGVVVTPSATRQIAVPQTSTSTVRRFDVVLKDRAIVALICAWLTGVSIIALRAALSVLQLRRIFRRSMWLKEHLGVQVYASPDVNVPITGGFSKPSVIVPRSLALNGGEQLECALLHEVGHVRRHDPFTHEFELALYVFLFFNPFVVWLLRWAALEREAACDDWAVACAPDLDACARSLVTLAIKRSDALLGALSFGHGIVSRVQRLKDEGRNGSLSVAYAPISAFGLLLVVVGLSLGTRAPAIAFTPPPVTGHSVAVETNGVTRKGLIVEKIIIAGDPAVSTESILAHIVLRPGMKYSDLVRSEDYEGLRSFYEGLHLELGSIEGGIVSSSIDANRATANVRYNVYAARIAEVRIVGATSTDEAAIRAQLHERRGAVLNTDLVRADYDRLKAAGYRMKVAVKDGPNPSRPYAITLEWRVAAAQSGRTPPDASLVAASSCTTPNAEATVISAASPNMPSSVAAPVGVTMLVTISSEGTPTKIQLNAYGNGHQHVDRAVIDAVTDAIRRSTFAAARKNCKPVTGTYLFHADFNPAY
ncbi:MAG: M56 family metallopeptidase [Candidatus Aquilonibacter sp.]